MTLKKQENFLNQEIMINNINHKKVFITGADGFIGSHLVELLVKKGAKIYALCYYNSWNEIGWLRDIDKNSLNNIEIISGDIRDSEFIKRIIKNVDYVFHLSSLIAIPHSYDAPRSYINTNIIGTLNILEGCRENKSLTRLIHISTSEVYGSAQTVPISESHPLVAQSPYSASKISADKLVESYYLSFNLPVVIARPFNTYGPRQTARAVIPTIASQLIKGNKEIRIGSLSPTRDFNYVTDTAKGMIEIALAKNVEGEVINIGSGEEFSIGRTLEIIKKILNIDIKVVVDKSRIRPEKSEVNRLVCDNTKIKKLTNWRSEVNFEEGLKKTIDWIQRNQELFSSTGYSK